MRRYTAVRLHVFLVLVNSIEQKLEIQWEICSHRNFDFKRPYLVNGAKFFDFGSRYVVTKFSAVRFWPFLAFMGLFLVIFWVLVVGHSGRVLPKYAPGRLGKRKDWEKRKFTCTSKMTRYT